MMPHPLSHTKVDHIPTQFSLPTLAYLIAYYLPN